MACGTEFDTPAAKDRPSSAGVSAVSLAELARFRELSYRLLSQSLLYPDDAVAEAGCVLASDIADEAAILEEMDYSPQLHRLRSLWCEMDARRLRQLQTRYVSLFVATSDRVPCPPYESAYTAGGSSSDGLVLASIERDYATAGLSGSGEKKQSPDHISMELEFLAILCGREAQAWETGQSTHGLRHLEKERTFIAAHLGAWLPAFVRAVHGANDTDVYADIATAALSFVMHDRDLAEELAELFAEEGQRHESA